MFLKSIIKTKRPFIFTIQTSIPNQNFTLPLWNSYWTGTETKPANYKFKVDCGDGNSNWIYSWDDANKTHTYASANTYTIKIIGSCYNLDCYWGDIGDGSKLLIKTIVSWGDIFWKRIGFRGCTNLTTLPSKAGNFSQIGSLGDSFRECGLTSIPANLFLTAVNCIDINYCFYADTGLTSIPSGLFDRLTKVTNFGGVFHACSNITSIPSGLFDNCVATTIFQSVFNSCTSITSIPAGLFNNCPLVTDFSYAFYGTHISSIPSGLFDYGTAAITFEGIFNRE